MVGSCIMFMAIFYYEQEEAYMEIYEKNIQNEKEKKKWISILDTFPFFVVIYDNVKE
jgi:hypothetical protein